MNDTSVLSCPVVLRGGERSGLQAGVAAPVELEASLHVAFLAHAAAVRLVGVCDHISAIEIKT